MYPRNQHNIFYVTLNKDEIKNIKSVYKAKICLKIVIITLELANKKRGVDDKKRFCKAWR